jgi:hypothetical protein
MTQIIPGLTTVYFHLGGDVWQRTGGRPVWIRPDQFDLYLSLYEADAKEAKRAADLTGYRVARGLFHSLYDAIAELKLWSKASSPVGAAQ